MSQIEREAKLTVTPADYRRLMESSRVLECRDQLNVYYQDPQRLQEQLGFLRVRYEAGRGATGTVKVPRRWEGELREMVEIEEPLSRLGPGLFPRPKRQVQVATDLPGEMGRHFLAQGITHLSRLGWMRNHRCVVEVLEGGVVELDRTHLPDGSLHHEVEIETFDEELLEALLDRVRAIAPSATPSQIGKFSRFLSHASGRLPPLPQG